MNVNGYTIFTPEFMDITIFPYAERKQCSTSMRVVCCDDFVLQVSVSYANDV